MANKMSKDCYGMGSLPVMHPPHVPHGQPGGTGYTGSHEGLRSAVHKRGDHHAGKHRR